jgi:short-subunit dehydrogenase
MEPRIIVTGATGGLGSAFAQECARRGYGLFLTDLTPDGSRLAAWLQTRYTVPVDYCACDLTSASARGDLFAGLAKLDYAFWGLINVAGVDYEGAFLERSREQVLRLLRLNVEATLDMSHAVLPLRDKQKRFMLINVCSLAAGAPMPYKATYAASKRFLLDHSMALRAEIREFGTVTALCPSGMPTTPDTMRAIFAQGFWGKMTTVDPGFAAHCCLDAALKGRAVCIPGWINRMIFWGERAAPVGLVVRLIEKRWVAAQAQWLSADWRAAPIQAAQPAGPGQPES